MMLNIIFQVLLFLAYDVTFLHFVIFI